MNIYKVSVYTNPLTCFKYCESDHNIYDLNSVFYVRNNITFDEFKKALKKETGFSIDLNESSFDWIVKNYSDKNYYVDDSFKIVVEEFLPPEELNLY